MKKILTYITFVIIAVGFFLYILFPSETVTTYLAYRLAQLAPQSEFSIADARLTLPPGLVFSEIDIKFQKNPAAFLDRITVFPAYASFFKGRMGVDVNASLYDGKIVGYADFAKTGKAGDINADFRVLKVNLKSIPIIKELARYRISGILSGNIKYGGPSFGAGKGSAHFSAKKCGIEFDSPVIGLNGLVFDTGKTDITMEKQKINIEALDLNGRNLSVSATGSITLAANFSDSRIKLKGTLRPAPDILKKVGAFFPQKYVRQGGIPFTVTGTFSSMNYSFR
ncbi:MAG: type II secretion system protein GspN [Deltaproteobacteria bacterium]|nr:type II secretion system protein GspN [Deltaproteobacteria bacterium]